MDKITILWADDEIDTLKPQILFLKQKGYEVITVTNGYDAVEECEKNSDIDVVFLDESMPGITGLETLQKIKSTQNTLPVVMITKNEAEHIMEEAIGSQISDYLIKPINPHQILLTLKKIIDNKRLVREKTASNYRQDFNNIFQQINSNLNCNEWADIYKTIIDWELKLDETGTGEMNEILTMQKSEANSEFSKFVAKNYKSWVAGVNDAPVMSNNLLRSKVFPRMDNECPTFILFSSNL